MATFGVGQLAAETGLTVRTLHHYDELGLLSPSERTQAGYRRYGRDEVERLYRIVALRRLGLSLDEVATALDGDAAELESVVRRQLDALEAQMTLEQRLRSLLEGVLTTLERSDRPSVEDVIRAIGGTEMMEKYYTPEQLSQLAERRETVGEQAMRDVEREWEEIFGTLRAELEAGTAPTDPRLDPVRARMAEMIVMFHGGDEGLEAAQREV